MIRSNVEVVCFKTTATSLQSLKKDTEELMESFGSREEIRTEHIQNKMANH
jgi:hypothetical protein